VLEKIIEKNVNGFRMPRLAEVDYETLKMAGYVYDSSINPTFMPGRYNHFKLSKFNYSVNGIIEIPTAVALFFRIPLFWLSFKNFPFCLYSFLLNKTIQSKQPLCLYFHPWEFSELDRFIHLPKIIRRNSGSKMFAKFEKLLKYMKTKVVFVTMYESLKE
jgi:hypothetical protein